MANRDKRIFGNRPDCAYYLMIGLCAAATFVAFGGIFTYMGYWPEVAFHHKPENPDSIQQSNNNPNYYKYEETTDTAKTAYAVVGPLCVVVGLTIALVIGVLAIKYDCEYEPEEPKVAIMRLASEMSLNLSTDGASGKYEAIRTTPGGVAVEMQVQNQQLPAPV